MTMAETYKTCLSCYSQIGYSWDGADFECHACETLGPSIRLTHEQAANMRTEIALKNNGRSEWCRNEKHSACGRCECNCHAASIAEVQKEESINALREML